MLERYLLEDPHALKEQYQEKWNLTSTLKNNFSSHTSYLQQGSTYVKPICRLVVGLHLCSTSKVLFGEREVGISHVQVIFKPYFNPIVGEHLVKPIYRPVAWEHLCSTSILSMNIVSSTSNYSSASILDQISVLKDESRV